MASGKVLDSTVKGLIAKITLQHPKWLGKQVHAELHRRLKDMRYPRQDPDWPRLSAVQKELKRQEDTKAKLGESEDDRPWSLAALSFCDVSPEALPAIVRAWGRIIAEGAEPSLTIRQARWMGRLHSIFEDEWDLLRAATALALQEQVIEIAGAYPGRDEEAGMVWFLDFAALIAVGDSPDVMVDVGQRVRGLSHEAIKSVRGDVQGASEEELKSMMFASDSTIVELVETLVMRSIAKRAEEKGGRDRDEG